MAEFKDRLKQAMQNKNISGAELGRKVGISKSSMSQYIRGICKAKQDVVYYLALELGVSPSWLMGLEDNDWVESEKEIIIQKLDKLNDEQLHKILGIIDILYPDQEDI